MTAATVALTVTPDYATGLCRVNSGSKPGVAYECRPLVQGWEVRVSCTCTAGRMVAVADPEHGRWVLPDFASLLASAGIAEMAS